MLADVQQAIDGRPPHIPLLLLADFDGTLAEFAVDPAAPTLSAARREWLGRLATRPETVVGLVSGRPIADLRGRAPLPRQAYYAGLHGLEIDGPDDSFRHAALILARPHAAALAAALRELEAAFEGALVEPKGESVAFHVRGVAGPARAGALAQAEALAQPWVDRGDLRRLHGHFVVEYLPNVNWDKGDAVHWIASDVARRTGRAGWVVFLGDDRSDEDAFEAIESGLGVVVGDRPSRARLRLHSLADVDRLLQWLVNTE